MGPDSYDILCRSFLHILRIARLKASFLIVIIFIYVFDYNVIIPLYVFIQTRKCQWEFEFIRLDSWNFVVRIGHYDISYDHESNQT